MIIILIIMMIINLVIRSLIMVTTHIIITTTTICRTVPRMVCIIKIQNSKFLWGRFSIYFGFLAFVASTEYFGDVSAIFYSS